MQTKPLRVAGDGLPVRGGGERTKTKEGEVRLRLKVWLGLSTALLLAAAACGGDQFEPGPLGAVEVAEGERIQIRSLEWYFDGLPSELERATQLAIQDYGPIKGRTVDIGQGLDEMCSAEGGLAGAQIITADPKVVGVMGTSCSVAAAAAMPLISEAGMVMVSGGVDAPDLTSDLEGNPGSHYRKGFYRVSHNGLHASETVAAFLRNGLGLDRAAVIYQDDVLMKALAHNFTDFFQIFGGEVTSSIQIEPDRVSREDLDPVLDEIVASNAQAVFIPVFFALGLPVVEAAHHHEGTTDIPLVLQTLNRAFRGHAESAGVYFTNPDRDFDSHVNDHTGRNGHQVQEEYAQVFEEISTNRFWPGAYDATTMLLAAIDEAAVERGGSLWIDRQALRDALDATDFNGITGLVKCDEFGDCGRGFIDVLHHESPDDFEGTHDKIVFQFTPE